MSASSLLWHACTTLHACEPPVTTKSYACRQFTQYRLLLERYFKTYWRSPPYNTTRLFIVVVAALLLGTFYFSRGDVFGTPSDLVAVMGMLLVSVMFVGFINFQMIIPTFYMERPVMWRERASAMYAVLPWVESMQARPALLCAAAYVWEQPRHLKPKGI
jgi:hypothetical protein